MVMVSKNGQTVPFMKGNGKIIELMVKVNSLILMETSMKGTGSMTKPMDMVCTITTIAATIIKESDIHHPAAKMVAMAAKMQEQECGDGSNFVLSLAGELMVQAQRLIQMGLHPSEILIGYEKAANKVYAELEN